MITVRTSPQYVNRVRQDWTANGGVYGDDGVYAIVPSNDPFAQLGPTLDLTFAGIPTNQFTAATTDGYSINLNLSSEIYQIAAEYVVWSDYQVKYSLLPNALINAALNIEPEKSLFKDTLIGGRPLGDINNDGSVTSADATAYTRFNGSFWLNTADRNDYIRTVLNPYMLANPGLYAAYLSPGPLAAKTFADVITFTRASTGTYFDSAGVLQSAANDQPRFDYNPATLAAQGLLIEEARTNSIRNNTMQGAVVGTPGTLPTTGGNAWFVSAASGLATNVIATGVSAGITYIDIQLVGTATGASYVLEFEPATGVAGSAGQTWTNSFWLSQVGGTTTNITGTLVRIQYRDSAGVMLATGSLATSTLSGTLIRSQFTSTAPASTAFVRPGFQVTTSAGAVDITLRIGLPQLEQGAFATSVIPTTTTALTRSADVASVNTLSPWLNQAEGTLFAEFTARLGVTQTPVTFSGVGGIGYRVRKSGSNQYYAALRDGTVKDIAITPSPALTEDQIIKVAVGVKLNDCALSGGGQSAVTQTSFSPMPTITDVNLGFTGTDGFALNGWFRRFTYYPRRLPNADLQTITA